MLLQASVMVEQLDSDAVDGPGSELLEKAFGKSRPGQSVIQLRSVA